VNGRSLEEITVDKTKTIARRDAAKKRIDYCEKVKKASFGLSRLFSM
jgi:hypothetical protein